MNGSDDEQHDAHVMCYIEARFGDAVANAYDRHFAAAGSTDERDAAYSMSVGHLIDGQKENPAFGNVLNLAVVVGLTGPLKDYLASDKPLSPQNRLGLIAFIEGQEQLIASREKKRGRPQRDPAAVSEAERAERNAAWLVAFCKAAWCKEHDSERVPEAETRRMIALAIAEASKAFSVPAELIKEDNIRSALKSGRIVVR
jgi:hypothetical protein